MSVSAGAREVLNCGRRPNGDGQVQLRQDLTCGWSPTVMLAGSDHETPTAQPELHSPMHCHGRDAQCNKVHMGDPSQCPPCSSPLQRRANSRIAHHACTHGAHAGIFITPHPSTCRTMPCYSYTLKLCLQTGGMHNWRPCAARGACYLPCPSTLVFQPHDFALEICLAAPTSPPAVSCHPPAHLTRRDALAQAY